MPDVLSGCCVEGLLRWAVRVGMSEEVALKPRPESWGKMGEVHSWPNEWPVQMSRGSNAGHIQGQERRLMP